MSAPIPKNEKKRLEVLWQHDVLDTAPEGVFDDLTELAALVCDVPIALISLLDEDRQWFKSRVGIEAEQTPRSVSFCAHAIMQQDLFVVPDATKDPRFCKSPLVTGEPRVRFYAGMPLITRDGYALGTLCINDRVPRRLTSVQQQALRVIARHIVRHLEIRRGSGEPSQPVRLEVKTVSSARASAKRS